MHEIFINRNGERANALSYAENSVNDAWIISAETMKIKFHSCRPQIHKPCIYNTITRITVLLKRIVLPATIALQSAVHNPSNVSPSNNVKSHRCKLGARHGKTKKRFSVSLREHCPSLLIHIISLQFIKRIEPNEHLEFFFLSCTSPYV